MTDEKLLELRAAYERVGMLEVSDDGRSVYPVGLPSDKKTEREASKEIVTVWNQLGDLIGEAFAMAEDARRMRETMRDAQNILVEALSSTTARLQNPTDYWQSRTDPFADVR